VSQQNKTLSPSESASKLAYIRSLTSKTLNPHLPQIHSSDGVEVPVFKVTTGWVKFYKTMKALPEVKAAGV